MVHHDCKNLHATTESRPDLGTVVAFSQQISKSGLGIDENGVFTQLQRPGTRADGSSKSYFHVMRGSQGSAANTSSRRYHMRYHVGSGILRNLTRCSADAPEDLEQMLDIPACDACLSGKTGRFGSEQHVPECTKPGEIICSDLWSTRVGCVYNGEKIMFGWLDVFSGYGDFIKIPSKTSVPKCIGMVLHYCDSKGIKCSRIHVDNEAIFHSPEAKEATVTKYAAQGILVTSGSGYVHRQNGKMEKRFRDTATAAQVQNSVDDTFCMLSMVDANKKRMKLPLVDDPDNSRFSLFHGYKADISMDRAFGCLTYFALEHEFNDTSSSLAKSHDRSRRGLHVAHGGDGSLRDRRQPGYYNFTADYNQSPAVALPLLPPAPSSSPHIRSTALHMLFQGHSSFLSGSQMISRLPTCSCTILLLVYFPSCLRARSATRLSPSIQLSLPSLPFTEYCISELCTSGRFSVLSLTSYPR